MHTPPIGWRVLWYPHADKRNDPTVADVTDVHPNGTVDLTFVPPRGGECRHGRGIRHITDPLLTEHPEAKRSKGGWDWVAGLVAPAPQEEKPQEEKSATAFPVEEILKLHESGAKPGEIALKLNAKGLTKNRVQQILDKHLQTA